MISIFRNSMVSQLGRLAVRVLNHPTTVLILMDAGYAEYAFVNGRTYMRRMVDYDKVCLQ